MNNAKIDGLAIADAITDDAGLPRYKLLLNFVQRMAYPRAGELLILEDYRNIARNIAGSEIPIEILFGEEK